MKDQMLIIGLGQAGGNMSEDLYKRNFSVFCINSSTDDLNSLEVKEEFKMHIRNAQGTAKDRNLSKQLVQSVAKQLIDIVNDRYASVKYIHVISSLGGGTGGGSVASIINMLDSVTDKKISSTIILPSSYENIRIKNNAIEAFAEMSQLQDRIGPIFLLSNERLDKFRVNKMHAEVLDDLVNLRNSNKEGSLDAQELEEIMTTKGIMIPHQILSDQKIHMPVPLDCYANLKGRAKLTALSLSRQYRQQEIHKFETFRGVSVSSVARRTDDKNYAFYCSIAFDNSAIREITAKLKEEAQMMKSQQEQESDNQIEIETVTIDTSVGKTTIVNKKAEVTQEEIVKEEIKSSKNVDLSSFFKIS